MDIACLPSQQRVVVQRSGRGEPWHWFVLGWRDLCRAPADTLLYGALFALLAYMTTSALFSWPVLVLPCLLLLMLATPFMAVGLYDIARQQEAFNGGRVMLWHSAMAWRSNAGAIALHGMLLLLLCLLGGGLALLLFALCYQGNVVQLEVLPASLLQPQNWLLSALLALSALLLLCLWLALSVCALPMLLDKEVDAVTAMQTSWLVLCRNGVTIVLWAVMMLALIAIGLASQFTGLLLVMPLLALTRWHAYRALVSYTC